MPLPRRHPVHITGADCLDAAHAVAMNHFAFEQVGERRQADMRMRLDVGAVSCPKHHRPKMIQEDEGTYHPALRRWQRTTNFEAVAQIPDRRKNYMFNRRVTRSARNGHCCLLWGAMRSGHLGGRRGH